MINSARADDCITHGQIIIRWSRGYPRDGIIAVNDKVAITPVLKQPFVASTDKKVSIRTKKRFLEEVQTVLGSNERYLLITKSPVNTRGLLVDNKSVPSDVKRAVIRPYNDRPDATKLGQNQSITQEEAEAYEAMTDAGYDVFSALLEETAISSWPKFRSKFGH